MQLLLNLVSRSPLLLLVALPVPAPAAAAPAVAEQDAAAAALALPACRSALGLAASASGPELLRADPTLADRIARAPACRPSAEALARLEQLEQALAASRQRIADQQAQLARETARQDDLAKDLAQLRRQLTAASPPAGPPASAAPSSPAASAAAPVALAPAAPVLSAPAAADVVTFTPGKGLTLKAGGSQLRLQAEAKLLGFSSSRYVFNPGQPLVVSPKNPDASYDLSAQQSTVSAAFQGPTWGSWTPGAYALFTLQDNLLAEGYSFTPVAFYGEMNSARWRLAAGQNFDVFAPRDPDNLASGKLAASGNPGSYRPQLRLEHRFGSGATFGGVAQLAASSPITTALPKDVDLGNLQTQELVEDNGWPNVEARLAFGFGPTRERAGGRQLRSLELGFSGVVGQLRVLDNIRPTDPVTLVADRTTVAVWGAAFDGQLALGRRFGLSGELYTGQGLGEYMAGIFQSYNRLSNQPVPTSGGWGQLYAYPAENLRLNVGYGIDNASNSGLLKVNSTVFANLVWDVKPWLQLGLEGNYKFTTYDVFGDKNAWVVISEVLFRL